MRMKLLILLGSGLLQATSLLSQCPDRDILWTRLRSLRSSKLQPSLQLKDLLSTIDSLKNCPYRYDSTHIYLLRKIAEIYSREGDFINAVQYQRQAIAITTANAGKPSVKMKALPGIYFYLAVDYDSLNNFTEKMIALDSCSSIAMRLNHVDRASLRAIYTQVEYFFDMGDYHRCIDYAEKCQALGYEYAANNTGVEKTTGEGFVSSSLGWEINALLKLNKYEAAEELLKNKIDEYRKSSLKDYLALSYGQMAEVQLLKGNTEKALFYYNLCLKYYQEIRDNFNCKQTVKDIAYKIYFKQLNDVDKALAHYRKALKYINNNEDFNTEDVFESLNIFANIGELYARKGVYDSAFKYFQLAFDQVKKGSNEEAILHSTTQEMMQFKRNYYLTGLLINKADAYRKQYEEKKLPGFLQKAISIYKVADQLLDKFKVEQKEIESRLYWRSDSRRLYENAIEACILGKNIHEAFYFFEKSRAVLLQDQLAQQRWMDEASILKQTQIKKKILQLQREYDTTDPASKRCSELKNEKFSQLQELDRLEEQIKSNNPLYFQNYMDTLQITLEGIKQNVLRDHQALAELFVGDSAIYILLITANGSHFNKVNKARFDSLTVAFNNYISNPTLQNSNFPGFVHTSSQLYQLVFQNIPIPNGRIIISPGGQYFPFEALITSRVGQPIKWFVQDHAVSYTYSGRFLLNDFNSTRASRGKNFLGIAPVKYPSSFSLSALPGSDYSLHKIADYFDNAVSRVSSEASRMNFMQQFSDYKIIQLYTHAAGSSLNNEPVIYFADSALYLSDLVGVNKPSTNLIVLSACETGKGKLYQGEGVFSFNRGFAALGIPAAITNLWSVDNESTYMLTELFYKWLAKGLPTDVALQKAKLEFLKTASGEKSMPCYWAGPVLVGKTDAIELSKPYPWKWIALFLSIGGIVFFAVRKWAISKKKA